MRRLPVLLVPLLLVAGLVAGCGGEKSPLDAVTISGKAGTEPKVTWQSEMTVTKLETTVLEKGDGATLEEGDKVNFQAWIGNGLTKKQSFNSWESGTPQTITIDKKSDFAWLGDAMRGEPLGSRIVVTATGEDLFGASGQPSMEIGNKDPVLVILDLISLYEEPKPTDVPSSKLPKVVEKDGKPVALDFSGLAEPDPQGDLLRSVVKQGKGATITPEMTVTANYLGQVYGGKEPFDESFSAKPVDFSLSQVIPGWTYGLAGVKVGSRVLLQIPPDLAYGSQEQAGIPANSTLYFVVDIVKAQ